MKYTATSTTSTTAGAGAAVAGGPLRERLLSNASDPIKSSILRESGHGWNPTPSPPSTTPLRIAKRDLPSALSRRTSSSYKHVRNNQLVSNSPFKSLIPTPSATPLPSVTRRVSGEKRPRPNSMAEQSENERPFPYKRERRQSKGFQNLMHKEVVTKSPFKAAPSHERDLPQTPPKQTPGSPFARGSTPTFTAPTSPESKPNQTRSLETRIPARPSPTRSSLVSRRMHGPRASGSARDGFGGRRARRKTVTFHEECDVVEFEPEEEETESDAAIEDDQEDESQSFEGNGRHEEEHDEEPDDSYEGVPLDAERSFSLESILHATRSPSHSEDGRAPKSPPTSTFPFPSPTTIPSRRPPTPPKSSSQPASAESKIFDELCEDQQDVSYHDILLDDNVETVQSILTQSTPPFTPLRSHPVSSERKSPLRKPTYAERAQTTPETTDAELSIRQDAEKLPSCPTLVNGRTKVNTVHVENELVTKLGLAVLCDQNDPFAIEELNDDRHMLPQLKDEPLLDLSFLSRSGDSIDPPNMSLEHSEVSVEGMGVDEGAIADIVAPSGEDTSFSSCESRDFVTDDIPLSQSAAGLPPRAGSPVVHIPSTPSSRNSQESNGSRPRISREEVQRRLMGKRDNEGEGSKGERAKEKVNEMRERDHEERERTSTSMSVTTDGSAEAATIERVERRVVGMIQERPSTVLGSLSPGPSLNFDFGSKFGRGLDLSLGSEFVSETGVRMEVSQLDVDMDMRSALDRLMDDVAGNSSMSQQRILETPDDSVGTSREDSMVIEEEEVMSKPLPRPVERAATDSALLPGHGFVSPVVSRNAHVSSIPPPLPPKDAIRIREELILEKRREARQREEDESVGYYTPPKHRLGPPRLPGNTLAVMGGGPTRRRSMSTGDLEELDDATKRRGVMRGGSDGLLDIGTFAAEEDPLADSIDRELRKLENPRRSQYLVREREETIYASSDSDRISHMDIAGDVDAGKAWRMVRRPSDMNEYSKQIKAFRAEERPGKAHGKVFVKVLGLKAMNVPIPQCSTMVTCTLNNGIHFVTTPESRFGKDCRIEQEFELIEHNKLEFTLTLKIRRDPHIIAQFKAVSHAPPIPPRVLPAPSRGGVRSFFMSSPKKPWKEKTSASQQVQQLPENLARYLKPDGTLARAFISFKDITHRCDSKLFETTYPLIGQKVEAGNSMSTLQVGEIVLQIFRLPPLPGIPPDQLPQSLEECHRGLRHVNWHKVTYFEGTLTQNGGDCTSWRRRQLRVIGANLIAFNDVTRKATATIDLKKAIAVEDEQDKRTNLLSPASETTSRGRYIDEYESLYGVERSFRLIFPHEEEIIFFADTDSEKAKWLGVFRALVGHVPPHPLWAELLWQQQEEIAKRGKNVASRPLMPPSSSS